MIHGEDGPDLLRGLRPLHHTQTLRAMVISCLKMIPQVASCTVIAFDDASPRPPGEATAVAGEGADR